MLPFWWCVLSAFHCVLFSLACVAGLPRPGRSPSWRRLEWSGSRTTWKCASRRCSRTAELTLLAQLSFLLECVGDIDCSILCTERSFLHCCSTAQLRIMRMPCNIAHAPGMLSTHGHEIQAHSLLSPQFAMAAPPADLQWQHAQAQMPLSFGAELDLRQMVCLGLGLSLCSFSYFSLSALSNSS